ncbi:lipoprotein LprG [Lentzea fradiae]|uniref:Lipoprotein LprG n=1 Tax=Lentzea fradiae TaxID=200378 RepID=A0A1G8C9S7_9PSEU|nr:lipoprotein LprG [Lentzea fradiae]
MSARWLLVCALALLTSCTSGGDLPDGATLLSQSAETMRGVKTVHFTIKVDGELPDVPVKDADGDLTSAGESKGTAKVTFGGQLLAVEYVLTGGNLHFKGPTGGYTKLPAAFAGQVYDPSAILDPDRGVAKVLASAKDAKTKSSGDVSVVEATVPKDVAAGLVPGISEDVKSTFSLGGDQKLKSALFELPGGQKVDIGLSDFDKSVTVTAPE